MIVFRPLSLLTALALAAPMPALAQTYPASATVLLGVRSLAVQPRTLALNDATATATYARFAAAETTRLTAAPQPLKLKSATTLDAHDVPAIELRAKDAWFDDQGFRASPTRLSYKARF
jgi:hypothetical protein